MSQEKENNYFYKITNKITNQYYYGIHSTNNVNDGYFGGGHRITHAVKKYGKENFQKEIICNYSTRKEASDHERMIVNEELLKDTLCYNLKTGGDNEFTFSEESKQKVSIANKGKQPRLGIKHTEESKQKMRDTKKGMYAGEKNPFYGRTHSEESIRKMLENRDMSGENNGMFGRNHSDETKRKISEKNKGRFVGEKNPIYGTIRSESTREKISEANIGKVRSDEYKEFLRNRGGSNGKNCQIDGEIFVSIAAASRKLNFSSDYIRHRLDSDKEIWKDWKYIFTS